MTLGDKWKREQKNRVVIIHVCINSNQLSRLIDLFSKQIVLFNFRMFNLVFVYFFTLVSMKVYDRMHVPIK